LRNREGGHREKLVSKKKDKNILTASEEIGWLSTVHISKEPEYSVPDKEQKAIKEDGLWILKFAAEA